VRWFTNAAAIRRFVGYLLRYNDDGRSKMSQMMSDPTAKGNLPSIRNSSSEVKSPARQVGAVVQPERRGDLHAPDLPGRQSGDLLVSPNTTNTTERRARTPG